MSSANKVAMVTASFWVIKIAATTLGETAGDLLAQTMNVGYGVSTAILISFFLVFLCFQLFSKTFRPWLYWMVILATSTAGTTMSDFMDRTLGWGYTKGAVVLVCTLLGVLATWRIVEGSLSVNSITTRRAEVFYWFAILASNTLGTAAGDFLADDLEWGFLMSAGVIGGILVGIMLLHRYTNLSKVLLFWVAFVLTRPFGATFGDLLTKTQDKGGMGFGTVGASVVLALLMVGSILWTHRKAPSGAG